MTLTAAPHRPALRLRYEYRPRSPGRPSRLCAAQRARGGRGGTSGGPEHMSRRPARCTQADIRRAIKAVEQAGASMAVEILPDGTIRLTPVSQKPEDNAVIGPQRRIVL